MPPSGLVLDPNQVPGGQSAIWSTTVDLASLNLTSISSSASIGGFSHRRRSSSSATANSPQALSLQGIQSANSDISPSKKGSGKSLPPIPGTPNPPMSLSRSPSPRPGGGWASPGLNSSYGSGRSSPQKSYRVSGNGNSVTWESAKAKTEGVNGGLSSFSSQNQGFFGRHYRRISNSLPQFNIGSDKSYAEKEKLGRGRWMARHRSKWTRLVSFVKNTSRKTKICVGVFLAFIFMFILFYSTRKPSLLSSIFPLGSC